MPDVRMPDGTIIRNVPEGTTRAQLEARYRARAPKENPVANVVGGAIEGALAIPDALWDAATGTRRVVNRGVGKAGSAALRAVGAEGAADWWERGSAGVESDLARMPKPSTPATRLAPPPRSTSGQVARFGAQMLGGALVPVGPKVTPPTRLPRPAVPRKGVNMDVIQAGQRQKIPVRRPDANPALRGDMAHAKSAPYSGPVVSRALKADKDAIQARVAQIAGDGNVQPESYNMGQQIQKVGEDFIKQSGKYYKRQYAQVDELANGQRVSPKDAIAEIDRNIAELEAQGAFTNSGVIDYLRGLRGDLAKQGGFSVPEFQGLRSAARKKISGNAELTVTDADRRLGNVVRAFSGDARQQLPKAAADLLDETDAGYSQRMGFIKDVLQKHVLGRKSAPYSAETAAKNVSAMAKNRADYDTFARLWDKTDPQTRADFSATFASNLGAGRNGEFGLGALATDIGKVPSNIRQTIFGNEGAANLDDIALLARAKSDTASGLNNSKTGDVLLRQVAPRVGGSMAVGFLAGGPTGAIAAPALMEGASAVRQLHNARKLLNPDYGKILTQGIQAERSPMLSEILSRLSVAAPNNPVARNELTQLSGLLDDQYLARLAADDAEEQKKKKR